MREIFTGDAGQIMPVEYRGTPTPLLKLALVTTVLTVITLGIYRFWARTRIRRYFWSALAPGGDALEYTGTGLEKFVGFLIAVAFLAVYLGLVQLGLMFAGLSMFSDAADESQALAQVAAQYITFLAILPLIFYAQYRGRRYILSRTRWRGLRFGVEKAALGYVWRGMVYTLLSVVSLGLLLPLQVFRMEKYRVDRTWFGTARFVQAGRWYMLYPAAVHVVVGALITVLPLVIMALRQEPLIWAIVISVLGLFWITAGFVYFFVHSFRILTRYKVLDEVIRFRSLPRTGKVIGIYILGSTAASLIASVVATLVLGVLSATAAGVMDGAVPDVEAIMSEQGEFNTTLALLVAAGIGLFYLFFIVLFSALTTVFIRQPILEHYAQNSEIIGADRLAAITQRPDDEMVEAEGFADALDIGAGI